jgi:4-amino-4-deoxy-L-arabinose transferase-like glycosyltransferase
MSKSAFASNRSLTDTQWLFGLFVAAIVLWCLSLGNLPLRDWDEGYYAIVAREMYRTGNWLYPTYLGEPFLLKPPLMQWLVALFYHLGGVGELTTRLPPALLSACGVPLLYLVGKEVFPQRLPAIFAALVYLTLLPVVRHGRLAMLDGMSITFFLLLLLCLLKSRQDRRWATGIGIGLGLIALTKGMLMVLLGAIAGVFLLADRQLALLRSPYFWIGIVLGNVPVLGWYGAQWQHYGSTFMQVHFQSQALERISTSVEGHDGPPWYYLLELLKYTWPWFLFWFGGLHLAWQQRHTRWGSLILIGTIGYLGIISIMNTKLPWYIMPFYPFFALAVAAYTSYLVQNSKHYSRIFVPILSLLAIGGVGGCIYFALADPQPVLILMGVVVAVTMGLAAWRVKQRNPTFTPILFVGMYLALGLLMISKSWIWELNEAFPVKPVAALIREQVEAKAVVYTSFAYGRPSLDFYSDRPVIPATATDLQKLWATQPYLLLDQSTLAALQLPNSVSLGTAEGFTLVAPKIKGKQT